MLQVNPFPQNILAALDSLAELGKAAQGKTKTERAIHLQEVDENGEIQPPKKPNQETQGDWSVAL